MDCRNNYDKEDNLVLQVYLVKLFINYQPTNFKTDKKCIYLYTIDKKVYADQYIMSHMTLERELPGHTGCVNTLE